MPKVQSPAEDLDHLPLTPRRWKFVLALLLARHNWHHSTKDKGVSHATMEERRLFCFRIFTFLKSAGYRLDPRSLSGRHVEVLMAEWRRRAMAGELGAASLQKYHSFLVTFAGWIGKPKLVKPLASYFDDPSLITRTYCATAPKAWRQRGVDVEEVISQVDTYDQHAATGLRLMHAFGLRIKEACMFRPHTDVITATQAGLLGRGDICFIRILRGSKGGRLRHVAVDSVGREQAIASARALVIQEGDSISDPRLTLVRAIRRMRYVMERFGITKKDLGVTPHGLRHEYSTDGYRDATGVAAPVHGGDPVDRALDIMVRQGIAERLGHGRIRITDAYLGSSALMRSKPADRRPGVDSAAPDSA